MRTLLCQVGLPLLGTLLAVLGGGLRRAEASGLETIRMTVDFTRPEEAASVARWSLPDRFRCRETGLGWEGSAKASYDLAVHVTRPMALGHPWWAATNAQIRATATWAGPRVEKIFGTLYVRQSPDAEHWTPWTEVPRAPATAGRSPHEHHLRLSVPRERLEGWVRRLARHRSEGAVPPQRSQSAAAAWVERQDPGYLVREQPFLGYLQFLYEASAPGDHALQRLDLEVGHVIPGPWAGTPVDPEGDPGAFHQRRWDYRTGPDAFRSGSPEGETAAREVLGAALRAAVAEAPGGGVDRRELVTGMTLCDRTALGPRVRGLDLPWDSGVLPFPETIPGLREDFVRRNGESRLLPSGLEAGVPVTNTTRDGAWDLAEGGRPARGDPATEWRGFHGRNPGSLGLVWVSEPAFSDDGAHAIVHVAVMWRHDAGSGRFYLLSRGPDAWVVTGSEGTWSR